MLELAIASTQLTFSLHADTNIVQVPRIQFGLLNSTTVLSCSVNITGIVIITWTNPSRTPFDGTIDDVERHHEGQYSCEVHISEKSLTMQKSTQFTVIGELCTGLKGVWLAWVHL